MNDSPQYSLGTTTELKELINLHADAGHLGGDLKTDTVTIIGATLDIQEKASIDYFMVTQSNSFS